MLIHGYLHEDHMSCACAAPHLGGLRKQIQHCCFILWQSRKKKQTNKKTRNVWSQQVLNVVLNVVGSGV